MLLIYQQLQLHIAKLQSVLYSRGPGGNEPRLDLVFVVSENNRGWILERICRELQRAHLGSSTIHYSDSKIPDAKAYFFSHYSLLFGSLTKNPHLFKRPISVFYTHERETQAPPSLVLPLLKRASHLIVMNSLQRLNFLDKGIKPENIKVAIGAADPNIFLSHERGGGCVGLSSAWYPRKNAPLLLSVVKALPHRDFLLVGKGWKNAPEFQALSACSNFEYQELSYQDYPQQYKKMDVFLSTSTLEGGPIALIEAMMSNCVPVASRTGFAADIIKEGSNGYLFEVRAGARVVCEKIEQAFALQHSVRESVLNYSWENFCNQVLGDIPSSER